MTDFDAMQRMEVRMEKLEEEHQQVMRSVRANTAALEEFIDLGKALKIGLKLAGYVERVAVFFTKLAAAGAVAWGTWKFLIKEAIAHLVK